MITMQEASEKLLEHIKKICNNRKDEFTPFRYTLRCVNRRFKDVDITPYEDDTEKIVKWVVEND